MKELIPIFIQIITEFRYLNENFNLEKNIKITNYDQIFSKWRIDMLSRYKNISLSMHWATNSDIITENQVLFDIRYTDNYFIEIKYQFDPQYITKFRYSCNEFIKILQNIYESLIELDKEFHAGKYSLTLEFENKFNEWKKEIYQIYPQITLDIYWTTNSKLISDNKYILNLIYKDIFMLEIKGGISIYDDVFYNIDLEKIIKELGIKEENLNFEQGNNKPRIEEDDKKETSTNNENFIIENNNIGNGT